MASSFINDCEKKPTKPTMNGFVHVVLLYAQDVSERLFVDY